MCSTGMTIRPGAAATISWDIVGSTFLKSTDNVARPTVPQCPRPINMVKNGAMVQEPSLLWRNAPLQHVLQLDEEDVSHPLLERACACMALGFGIMVATPKFLLHSMRPCLRNPCMA